MRSRARTISEREHDEYRGRYRQNAERGYGPSNETDGKR